MAIVIAEFTKKGFNFEVSTNLKGDLFVKVDDTKARVQIFLKDGKHYYIVKDSEFVKKLGSSTDAILLDHESAETAETLAKEVAAKERKNIANAEYATWANDAKVTFELSYYHGAIVTSNAPKVEEIQELQELIRNNDSKVEGVFSQFGEVVSTWGGTEYVATKEQIAQIIEAFKKIEKDAELAEKEVAAKAEAEYQAILLVAKETNEPQILRKQTVDCDGSAPFCSQDKLYTMLNPDGKITYERIHLH